MCVHAHDAVLDRHRKEIQRSRRRSVNNLTADIECRRVARTGKALLIGVPGNTATKVCAFSMYSKKATILQSRQEELTVSKRGNASRQKTFDGTGNPYAFVDRRIRLALVGQ